MQVHGGMGFIEETGAAQYSRDVRVTTIYEGTNGIQAMDLVGRKMMDGGEAAFRLLDEIEAEAEAARAELPDLAEPVWQAAETLREATEWLVAQGDMNDRFAGAVPYLRGLRAGAGRALPPDGGAGRSRRRRARALARFYITRLLPEHAGLLAHAQAGAAEPLRAKPRRPGGLRDGRRSGAGPALSLGGTAGARRGHRGGATGVLWMRLPLPMKLDHVNVYALDEGDSWTVIDTGFDSRLGREIWTGLMAGPLGGKPVAPGGGHPSPSRSHRSRGLVPDRARGRAGDHPHRLALRADADRSTCRSPAEETLAYYRSAGMDPADLAERAAERPFNFADIVARCRSGFTRIQQGERIRMGGRDWDVHMGNGHAPEHATFWSRDDDLVIAGDQILPSISPNIGVYVTEPMADPLADWLETCERLAPMARPGHLVLGGHKLPFTGLPTRMRQLIDNHHGALGATAGGAGQPETRLGLLRRALQAADRRRANTGWRWLKRWRMSTISITRAW